MGDDRISIAAETALRAQAADPEAVARPETAEEGGDVPALLAAFGIYDDDEDERPLPVRRAMDLRTFYRRHVDARGEERSKELLAAQTARREFAENVPQVMVMSDEEERETHVLLRGRYDMHGETVEPGVPGVLPALPEGEAPNRLTLARWLFSGEHPLVARVAVNRAWRQYFGRGLVETVEDFGVRGELPSHPELLDWLAQWFVDSGWDQKALHRLLVSSAAYRQSARARAEVRERDPFGRAHASMPRRRLSAEGIRDNALWASGLLVEEIGGESVKPPQPSGLWAAVSQAQRYSRTKDEQQYRRGIYVYWKRGMLYPSLATFDAPMRESCTPRRAQTNTPLQALVLLNDPVWIEYARNLAERMLREGGEDDAARVAYGFRLCTSRPPSERELEVLLAALAEQRGLWEDESRDAKRFLKIGDTDYDEEVELEELAAWTSLGNVLLNLDASIHQG